jgi:pyridoxal 5'-phosphate synthase pdxS subunit
VLTPADDKYHIDKLGYSVPFVNGAKDLGEALRRIAEGSSMIRSKGEAGSGNIVEAVRHLRAINDEIALLSAVPREELVTRARDLGAPLDLVQYVAEHRKLPVVLFSAGGVATPADAALMMAMGAEGVFVGSGIFDGHNDEEARAFAKAIVDATTHWNDPSAVLAAHLSIPEAAAAMRGIDLRELAASQLLAHRGS